MSTDWNGNGKEDHFDDFMDMRRSQSDSPDAAKPHVADNRLDVEADTSGFVVFKCLVIVILCIGGMIGAFFVISALEGAAAMILVGAWLIAVATALVGMFLDTSKK